MTSVESVGNSRYAEVGKNSTTQIGGNATIAIGVTDVQLGATRPMQAFDDGPLQLAYNLTDKASPDAKRGHYRIMIAQSRVESIGTEAMTRIGHSMNTTVGTAHLLEVGADKTERVNGDSYETIGAGRYMHVQERIDFRCGKTRFVMRSSGEIEITGVHIKLNGQKIDLN